MHAGKHTEYEKRLIEAMNSRPPPPQTTIASQLDKILAPTSNSQQNKRLGQETTEEDEEEDDAVTDAERTGLASQLTADEQQNADDYAYSNENDDNVAQFQSVEDPAPSNPEDETVGSRRSNATARERQWSERDEISVAPSNTPPTDPEANENEFEEENNRCDINEFSHLTVDDDRLDRLSFSDQHDYLHSGIPAPAKHQEAPAPLMQWEALLGLTTHQPTTPAVVEPSTLFSSFKLDSFYSTSMLPNQSSATNSLGRREPSPPPGLGRFNSDDDLGFDPFTESSKGLTALLQEEQEQIPPHASNSSGLDVLKQLFGQVPDQRQPHHQQQQQQHQQQQSHHHPLQQHQDHTFLHQLHAQQQQQQQQQQYAAELNRDFMFNRMMTQRSYDSTSGYTHPFGNVSLKNRKRDNPIENE
uniref:Uncharacterized protein n=1 Tax=Caenorhabditis japonica TaxID=281687 RepID=A0A8R1E3N0_CAEJA